MDIIDKMRALVHEYEPKIAKLKDEYEPKIAKLKALADRAQEVNDKHPTREGLNLEDEILDDLIKARTEYAERLDEYQRELDEASQKLFEEGLIPTPGYYKAAHSKDVHDVLWLAWQPKRAALTEYKKTQVMISTLDLGNGEALKAYWFDGFPEQDGIMLPQFFRKLWTADRRERKIRFNVQDYMELRGGLDNSTRTTENIIAECFRLAKTVFSYEKDGEPVRAFALVETHRLESGEMEITLSRGLHELFIACGRGYHQYPDPLFQINRNDSPNAWDLGMYISDKKSMLWHVWDGPSARFSTLELWEVTTLPTEAEARAWGSHFLEKIVRKLERDLNALEMVIEWEYEGSPGGKTWTGSFKDWKKAFIKITWKKNPYDSMDKEGRREMDRKRREVRLLELEKQKVKRGKGNR